MIKSKIFTFNEQNLVNDIVEYEITTGKEVSELLCNVNTYQIWVSILRDQCIYPVVFDEPPNGVGAYYRGIPIKINNNLDDGTVNIN